MTQCKLKYLGKDSLEKVYLSLGSNIGDRESNLAQATIALSFQYNIYNVVSSAYYNTDPLYNTEQPDFLNSIVRCETTMKPFLFFDTIKQIEKMLGKKASKKDMPSMAWKINDIREWMSDNDVDYDRGDSKKQLLARL